jgi:hypothetical protein
MMDDKTFGKCPECGLKLFKQVPNCPRCSAPIASATTQHPMVERVYIPDLGESGPSEERNVRRTATVIFVIVIAAILLIMLSYNFIIPRTELNIISVYRESTGLVINFDTKVENLGTLDIQHYTMNVTITNSSDGVVAKGDYYVSDLDAHTTESFDNIYFFGDQFERYTIEIWVRFESSGEDYNETFTHTVDENMLIRYEDSFINWGG